MSLQKMRLSEAYFSEAVPSVIGSSSYLLFHARSRLTRGLEHLELGEAKKELLRLAGIEADRGLGIVPRALEL